MASELGISENDMPTANPPEPVIGPGMIIGDARTRIYVRRRLLLGGYIVDHYRRVRVLGILWGRLQTVLPEVAIRAMLPLFDYKVIRQADQVTQGD